MPSHPSPPCNRAPDLRSSLAQVADKDGEAQQQAALLRAAQAEWAAERGTREAERNALQAEWEAERGAWEAERSVGSVIYKP